MIEILFDIVMIILCLVILNELSKWKKRTIIPTLDEHRPSIRFIEKRVSRTVDQITTEMLRDYLLQSESSQKWCDKSTYQIIDDLRDCKCDFSEMIQAELDHKEKRDAEYFEAHRKIHLRLSIKQTK